MIVPSKQSATIFVYAGGAVYRCEASSVEGFVQQLAVSYIGHGYWFYVTGWVPAKKDPRAVDRKLIDRYGVDVSKSARYRRKRAGLANVHYLRHGRFFVLAATQGEHRFFEEEKGYRDVRRDSLHFEGYSIGYKRDAAGKWHPSVRIHPKAYGELKARFLRLAAEESPSAIAAEFRQVRFAPFAPVRVQMGCVWRAVNAVRAGVGLEPVPPDALRMRRRVVRPFECLPPGDAA